MVKEGVIKKMLLELSYRKSSPDEKEHIEGRHSVRRHNIGRPSRVVPRRKSTNVEGYSDIRQKKGTKHFPLETEPML